MDKVEIKDGLYELTPGSTNIAKSIKASAKKMELCQVETGQFYLTKIVDKTRNIRKLYYPLSDGLSMDVYEGNLHTIHEKIYFEENGEIQIFRTNKSQINLTKVISYRKDGSVYRRECIFKVGEEQKFFHLAEDGKMYDDWGKVVLETFPTIFERQSYIDAVTARSKLINAKTNNGQNKRHR